MIKLIILEEKRGQFASPPTGTLFSALAFSFSA
ncbi:uncharacterized protein METZ01_LOCUS440235, partial [marine metagenome]